jgi:hypothetical protein
MNDFEYLVDHFSEAEILTILAEEASELAQAALKLRRTITDGAFPTQVTEGEALYNLSVENCDVDFAHLLWFCKREKRFMRHDAYRSALETDAVKIRAKLLRDRMERRKK